MSKYLAVAPMNIVSLDETRATTFRDIDKLGTIQVGNNIIILNYYIDDTSGATLYVLFASGLDRLLKTSTSMLAINTVINLPGGNICPKYQIYYRLWYVSTQSVNPPAGNIQIRFVNDSSFMSCGTYKNSMTSGSISVNDMDPRAISGQYADQFLAYNSFDRYGIKNYDNDAYPCFPATFLTYGRGYRPKSRTEYSDYINGAQMEKVGANEIKQSLQFAGEDGPTSQWSISSGVAHIIYEVQPFMERGRVNVRTVNK